MPAARSLFKAPARIGQDSDRPSRDDALNACRDNGFGARPGAPGVMQGSRLT